MMSESKFISKRVLYIVSNPFMHERRSVGGNISSCVGVIMGLVSNGFEVVVVSDSEVPSLDHSNDKISLNLLTLHSIRSKIDPTNRRFFKRLFSLLDKVGFHLALLVTLPKLMLRNDFDFVYMRASFNGGFAARLLKFFGMKLVLEVNKPLSMGPYNNKDALQWPAKGTQVRVSRIEKEQYRAAHLISVDSSLRARWLWEFVDPRLEKKTLINFNGVDTSKFEPCGRDAELRGKIGLSRGAVVVGMASSFRWYNDLAELAEIISATVNQNPKIKWLLINADKRMHNRIRDRLSLQGLYEHVTLFTEVPFDDMPLYLDACDITVSHFNFHGKWPHNCSIKHMEYLSMGKPTVATRVGDVNYAIQDGKNGFLCEEGDIDAFVSSIVSLSNSVHMRRTLGRAGRKQAVSELSWDKHVLNVLESL